MNHLWQRNDSKLATHFIPPPALPSLLLHEHKTKSQNSSQIKRTCRAWTRHLTFSPPRSSKTFSSSGCEEPQALAPPGCIPTQIGYEILSCLPEITSFSFLQEWTKRAFLIFREFSIQVLPSSWSSLAFKTDLQNPSESHVLFAFAFLRFSRVRC